MHEFHESLGVAKKDSSLLISCSAMNLIQSNFELNFPEKILDMDLLVSNMAKISSKYLNQFLGNIFTYLVVG